MFLLNLLLLASSIRLTKLDGGNVEQCSPADLIQAGVNGSVCMFPAPPRSDHDDGRNFGAQCPDCSAAGDNNDDKPPIYFLIMAPYPDCPPFNPSLEFGPSVVPAAFLAKDLINQRNDILRNYRIELLLYDSGCNLSSKAVNGFVETLWSYSRKNIVGVIGPACSESTTAIAKHITDDRMSLIQISPSATSPVLTNTTMFPNTFRPIDSALGFVDFYIDLIDHKKYKHVGAIYETARTFHTTAYTEFENAAHSKNIALTSLGLFNSHFLLDEFRNKIRVIFVFASLDSARKILCTAYHEDMLYPHYQFIFSNRKHTNFLTNFSFELDHIRTSCSREEMEIAIIGMVFNDYRLTREDRDNSETEAGVSYDEFSKQYSVIRNCQIESLGLKASEVVDTDHHSGYFDSVWALALSLNNSLPHIKMIGLSLSNYTFKMPAITQKVREELLKLSFEGMRGRVQFSKTTHDGSNVTYFDMYQTLTTGSGSSIVGYYNNINGLTLLQNASLIKAEFDFEYLQPHAALGGLVTIAVAILFATLFICQIANITWGKRKTVKADSPNLNHLMFSGCYLSLVGVVFYTYAFVFFEPDVSVSTDIIIPVHCSALQWTGTLAYSMVFGTLIVKRWRIYRIFHTFSTTPMKLLTDKALIFIALAPATVDVIVNIAWNSVDPWYSHIERGQGLLAKVTCRTHHERIWYPFIAVPKAILTLIILYLAIATRRVHRKEFRQTKSINILIFCLLILQGIFLPLFFILLTTVSIWTITLSYLSFCLFELALVVLCIVFVFLPPLLPLIKEKVAKLIINAIP